MSTAMRKWTFLAGNRKRKFRVIHWFAFDAFFRTQVKIWFVCFTKTSSLLLEIFIFGFNLKPSPGGTMASGRVFNRIFTSCVILQLESVFTESEKQKYLDKFRKFANPDTFFGYMVGMVSPKEPLAVLCHGDCWTNNFLFQYAQDGSISDVRIWIDRFGLPDEPVARYFPQP